MAGQSIEFVFKVFVRKDHQFNAALGITCLMLALHGSIIAPRMDIPFIFKGRAIPDVSFVTSGIKPITTNT